MTCSNCVEARSRAKAEGHRNVNQFACYDCAAVDLDEVWARLGYVPDKDSVRKACREMGIPYTAPVQSGQQMELAL